jgi:hypothetical protein
LELVGKAREKKYCGWGPNIIGPVFEEKERYSNDFPGSKQGGNHAFLPCL